ncbi:hypothetical protein D4764_02G0004490 [Takifugu flavidus]|uniref:Uncharacterized protein n=1 Tax=Takifugu flavidus TaxID=433684 RepID=A0A5C6NKZ9_9TELE|nr:hypothetical protein D4764_02G0004490 [Takifugu flavidus]
MGVENDGLDELPDCESQAEQNRKKEHQAAVLIQSWFRGCKVRTYLRSEGRETRCNAIFSFVFTGSIFYYEDEFLQGDGSQGKYHHWVLFS